MESFNSFGVSIKDSIRWQEFVAKHYKWSLKELEKQWCIEEEHEKLKMSDQLLKHEDWVDILKDIFNELKINDDPEPIWKKVESNQLIEKISERIKKIKYEGTEENIKVEKLESNVKKLKKLYNKVPIEKMNIYLYGPLPKKVDFETENDYKKCIYEYLKWRLCKAIIKFHSQKSKEKRLTDLYIMYLDDWLEHENVKRLSLGQPLLTEVPISVFNDKRYNKNYEQLQEVEFKVMLELPMYTFRKYNEEINNVFTVDSLPEDVKSLIIRDLGIIDIEKQMNELHFMCQKRKLSK